MKRVMVVLFLGFIFVIFGGHDSFGQMCGCMDRMGERMHEDMPIMGGMRHHGMEMMERMKHEGMGMMEGTMGEDHPMWKHLMGLGLDEEQKEAIREIKHRLMKETIKKRADKKIAHLEMKDLLEKDPVDMNAVEAKLRQIEAIETDIRLSHIKAMEEVKAKLTPEQKKKMKEMIEMGPMMGGGMMGGMMEHCAMGGATPPAEKKEQPAMEHRHH